MIEDWNNISVEDKAFIEQYIRDNEGEFRDWVIIQINKGGYSSRSSKSISHDFYKHMLRKESLNNLLGDE